MTHNQIAYAQYLESRRSNQAKETETARSNLANERENERSHKAAETENYRSHVASETELNRSHLASETENIRSHKAAEAENVRSHQAVEAETATHNRATEKENTIHNRMTEHENVRHNQQTEGIGWYDAKTAESKLAIDQQNADTNSKNASTRNLEYLENQRQHFVDAAERQRHNKINEQLTGAGQIMSHYDTIYKTNINAAGNLLGGLTRSWGTLYNDKSLDGAQTSQIYSPDRDWTLK